MSPFAYKTNGKITSFRVTPNDISLTIKTLDPRITHGFDNISIKTIQICGEPIALPFKLIFETALKKKIQDIFKIANLVPVQKKR